MFLDSNLTFLFFPYTFTPTENHKLFTCTVDTNEKPHKDVDQPARINENLTQKHQCSCDASNISGCVMRICVGMYCMCLAA